MKFTTSEKYFSFHSVVDIEFSVGPHRVVNISFIDLPQKGYLISFYNIFYAKFFFQRVMSPVSAFTFVVAFMVIMLQVTFLDKLTAI